MRKIARIIKWLVYFFIISRYGKRRISIGKTIYYNFRLFPFHIAKKLPLFIHSGVKTYVMGKITIEGEIKRGMISIGRVDLKAQGISKIINSGEIIFKGPVILGGATILENSGKIIFEGQTRVGEGVTFLIRSQLTIGKYTSVGFHSFFMDSDDHYMINVQTGEVKENKKEIIIGKYNWIANGTMVKKGTRTPDYTIVASRSLLSKDYTNILSLYSIIGGMPAKSISSGYRRIYNRKEEALLRKFFTENDMPSIIIDLENINIDEYCTKNPLPN